MLSFFADFASSNPLAFSLLVWPLLSALVTGAFGAFGHLSEDDYARLPKALAFALRLFASSGVDAPAVLKLLWGLFGKVPPLPVLLAICLAGCAWFKSNQQALEPLEVDACVLGALEAGMPADAAAAFCKVSVDYVNSLLAKKASHKAAALAARDAGTDAAR